MMRPLRGPTPLFDFTNVNIEDTTASVTPLTNTTPVRRTTSFRALRPHADSSESNLSEHSSIYDAQIVTSTFASEEEDLPVDVGTVPAADLPISLAEQLNCDIPPPIAEQPQPSSPATSHSRWPQNPLETIAERGSNATLSQWLLWLIWPYRYTFHSYKALDLSGKKFCRTSSPISLC